MRRTLLTGLALLIGGVVVVLVSSGLELELESTALMGAAFGAALALVPDRSPMVRLGAFVAGFLVAWVGYFARAGLLPDTATGRAVALALVVVLCVGIAAVTFNRLPLWAILLGSAALAGGYEATYALAPSEVVDTSSSAVTTILLTVAVGFLAGSIAAPKDPASARPRPHAPDDHDHVRFDSMMENTR